jgi:hypothetical protein
MVERDVDDDVGLKIVMESQPKKMMMECAWEFGLLLFHLEQFIWNLEFGILNLKFHLITK